jgi:tape measure domain-containing protein
MANNRIAVLVALEGADDGLKRALNSAQQSLGELAASAKTAGQKAAAGMAEVKAGMSAFGDQVSTAKSQLLAFLSINWAAGKLQEIVQIADAWNMMGARLKLATVGQNEFVTAQRALFDIAQRIGVPIQEVSTLYGKLQQAVRMLGGEQKDALTITESISHALRLSGASATEAQSSLLQFGQALASGVLRGEEFNSVVENSPRLAQALADGLNVPIGRLRKLAEEGRLTADVVVNALMSQKTKLATEYAQLPQTVSQAFQRLQNAFGQWVSQVDSATGISKKLADSLSWLSANLDSVMQWLKKIAEVGLAVLIYRLLPALATVWQTTGAAAVTAANATSAAWATANLSASAAITSVGLLKSAFVVLGAFLVGWEIGTWLSEKFEVVRKAGIFMIEILVKAMEQLQYRWEAFAAIFTSDSINAATQRHQARLAEMNQIFGQMYLDATRGTEAAKAAMTTAASTAEEIAKRLEAVRQGTQEAVGRGVESVHAALEKLKSRLGEVEQAVSKANAVVQDATSKMAEAYKGLAAIVEANLQTQVDAIKSRFQQEQAALEVSKASEAEKLAKSTQLLLDSLTQQATLRRQALLDTLKLIDDESAARIAAAARQGATEAERSANVTRVENEILATKRQSMAQAATEYKAHIDALNAEANRHLAEIQRIEEAKRQLTMSTEDKIRELRRQGMGEMEAMQDRQRQVAELQSKARSALAAGEFEQARELAQKAMDLALQVGSSQTQEAKKGEEARKQSEQAFTQVATLESQAREATAKQEYDKASDLMRQADSLRAELAQKTKDSDIAIAQGKEGVNQSIQSIRESEEILNKSLDAQAQAHKQAAQAAVSAREQIKQTLTDTEIQIDQISAKLKDGLKITLSADTSRFDKAIAELDKALAEKERLLPIKLELEQAQKKLQEFEQLLKEGKTLPIGADVSQAKEALNKLTAYAKESSQLELRVSSEKAQASITNVEGMIKALDRIRTESQHSVSSNAGAARGEIQSLAGMNTSSTHTIVVRKVEANASGGVVGAGVSYFANGGYADAFATVVSPSPSPASSFTRMTGGSVPGTGNQDTVPRTLETGAFVLRKAAVQKYGSSALSKLVSGVARFASGGSVVLAGTKGSNTATNTNASTIKRNRDALEAQKMIDLGLQGMQEYTSWLRRNYGASLSIDMEWQTMKLYRQQAGRDQAALYSLFNRPQLTTNEKQKVDAIKESWRDAMAQPLVYGKDLERDLLAFMEQNQGRFYRAGGLSASDTVPAMLTPGEFVVNRSAVARFGAGFFESLNQLSVPAQALAQRVQGQIQGFANGGLVQSLATGVSMPKLTLAGDAGPVRTVRVELASGNRSVSATIDPRDETRLLDILKQAKSRSF